LQALAGQGRGAHQPARHTPIVYIEWRKRTCFLSSTRCNPTASRRTHALAAITSPREAPRSGRAIAHAWWVATMACGGRSRGVERLRHHTVMTLVRALVGARSMIEGPWG
jgi:hypothetical protein